MAWALLALALSAALWWSYFAGDDARAERALLRAEANRARLALYAYGYAHLAMLAGVVLVSAGVKQVIAHLEEHAGPAANWELGGGVALYLIGDALFRRWLALGTLGWRLLAGGLALASGGLGPALGGLAHLAALVLIVALALALEHHFAGRAPVAPA